MSDDTTKKFNKNLDTLKNNLANLIVKLDILTKYLTNINKFLIVLEEINKQIINLDKIIHTIDSILIAISVIPQIASEIDILDKNIKKLGDIIHSQRINAENLCNEFVEPTKNEVLKCNDTLKKLIKNIQSFSDEILDLQNKFSSLNNEQQNYIASKSNTIIEKVNDMLDGVISSITIIENKISIITDKLKFFIYLSDIINKIFDRISYLLTALDPLHKAMYQKVVVQRSNDNTDTSTVSSWMSIWNFIWKEISILEWYWQNKAEPITFTVNQILEGIDGVEDMVINELKREVMKILYPLLNEIILKIELPNIEELKKLENEVHILKGQIELNKIDIIENNFNNIIKEFDNIKLIAHPNI
ncbi:putative orfan [Tupanvirus soda lake]|uniref:Orfan n=1 Tax=Tupanvirus deep ocean TaxID=2126984 RepID=A0A2K9L6B3_9VIRU|nr:putative orfan [Tupanvirus soda lake]AUL78744.2 putative orfan [Tupanvirus soda lake]